MYIAVRKRKYKGKEYHSSQIVEGYRNEEGKVRQKTLLDISRLGMEKILAMKAALQGKQIVDWNSLEGLKALDFGIPYVVGEVLKSLELPEIISKLDKKGDDFYPAILGMITNSIDEPCAKHGLIRWIRNTALIDYPGIEPEKAYHHKTCYAALDFLEEHQGQIEEILYSRREKPARLFFCDITSTYFEGRKAELARYGYSRDHRSDRKQIVIGLVTDSDGIPVCVEVFERNTRDSSTVKGKIAELKNRFNVEKACFVGDRGMKTKANVEHLREQGLDFILAVHHREVLKLVEEHGPTQMGLFDERNIADIKIDDRRLVVCRNPIAGGDTKRRCDKLLRLTEEKLSKIRVRVEKGRLKKPDAIRRVVDRPFAKWKNEKFFNINIEEGSLFFEFDKKTIESTARLDGVYVIETTLSPDEMKDEEIQSSYKLLQVVERAFRCTKSDLRVRPVFHWKESRIRGHVFLCFLAYLVERILQIGLNILPESEKPEWKNVVSNLRGWRRVSVAGRPALKSHHPGFSPAIACWLRAWNIALPE